MDQNNKPDMPQQMPIYPITDMEDEINLIDLIYPIYKHRLFLIFFCIFVTLIVAVVTLKSAKIYEITAVVLPESVEEGSGSDMKAAFLEQYGIAGIGGSQGTSADLFETVLKSKTLAREVVRRLGYLYATGVDDGNIEGIASSLADSIMISKDDYNPTLSVAIQSSAPTKAADIINTYVLELDKYNRTNTVTSTKRLRKYIEQRLDAADNELDQAQQEVREFQEKNRAISISKQAEATIQILSDMEADRVALEVEKAAKEKFYKGSHIEIEQLKAQMEAIQKNISRLTYSDKEKVQVQGKEGDVEFYIPLNRIPALNFEESKLLLKVKAKTGVVTMLTTQLEQTKLDEARDMPTINILDWAKPPEEPVKPKLKLNVVLAFVVSLFLGIFIVFLMEFFHRMDEDPEASPKWREMKQGLRKLIPFVGKAS